MAMPLPPNLQQFANRQIASGKYASLEELLLAGLQVLAEQEQIYQGRFEELRREVLLGAAEAEQGQLLDATPENDYVSAALKHESGLSNYAPR
jgi:putative addiction module CopG family antidote